MMLEARKCGSRVRQARIYLGFSEGEIAGAIHLTREEYRLVETGELELTEVKLIFLSKLFQRPVAWLRGDVPIGEDGGRLSPVAVGELDSDDRRELELFAEFLRHRKAQREGR